MPGNTHNLSLTGECFGEQEAVHFGDEAAVGNAEPQTE